MELIYFSALDPSELILNAAQFMIILLFSLSFHESAHAWMAHKCGDDTARLLGRMTLNPIPHIDPFGTLLIPGMMIIMSSMGAGFRGLIGWAKPVPVNPLNFRNYRKGEMLVSLAGPFSNLILMTGGALICRAIILLKPEHEIIVPIFQFFQYFALINSVLFLFNLIPIPPLDGSHVLKLFLSPSAAQAYDRTIAPYGFFILMALMYFGAFGFLFKIMHWVLELVIFGGLNP